MAGRTKVRYGAIWDADLTDDQKSAVAILGALTTSLTQEQLQEFVLSQIKRIIHGNSPGNWYDDFLASDILSLRELADNATVRTPAECQSSDAVGSLVYATGPAILGMPQVTTVDPTNPATMPAIGMISERTGATGCTVTLTGLVTLGGLTVNGRYLVGPPGTITTTIPGTRPYLVQFIGQALDENRLMFMPSKEMVRLMP